MKKKLAAVVAVLAALVCGFLLPTLFFAVQDRGAKEPEDAGIEQVDLPINSGLSILEKMQMLCEESSRISDVGLGRNQDAKSLSQAAWSMLSSLFYQGYTPLDQQSAGQTEHGARLITNGENAFIFWQVRFEDKSGRQVIFYLDDETASPLGFSCSMDLYDDAGMYESQIYGFLWAMSEQGGFWDIVEIEGLEQLGVGEEAMYDGQANTVWTGEANQDVTLYATISDMETLCTIPLSIVGDQISVNVGSGL